MESSRIAQLLESFAAELSPDLLSQFDRYLELLMRWNARVNLTAIRDPEQIVARHFGESLFAARQLFDPADPATRIADVGSGAGFPGVPMKLWSPHLRLTLIESQNKKATFLRELIRTLELGEAQVFCGRAEQWENTADVVTMRAVEQFERVLPVAAGLVAPGGKLCLLIGTKQSEVARQLVDASWLWRDPVAIPQSEDRVVAIAARAS
jgi:16S rRNA (guanine527-N7)-methyltransferase